MTLRLGVVGCGLMGELHARAYRSIPGAELVGLVEPDNARHEALRAALDVPVYTDPARLWERVDAVSICTPDDQHRDLVLAAFAHDVRVLVEKPLATTGAEAAEIVAACPDPSYLMVGHILRFDPRVQQARAAVRSGGLGKLWSGRVWRCGSRSVGAKIAQRTGVDWFLGVHDVDLIRFVTGAEIASVRASAWSRFTDRHDLVRGELRLDSGVPIEVEWSWIVPDERSSTLRAGLELIGSDGMLEVDLSHSAVAVTTTVAGRQANVDTFHWPTIDDAPSGDLGRELAAFVESASTGAPTKVSGEDGRRAVAVIAAAERAYGTTEAVPTV